MYAFTRPLIRRYIRDSRRSYALLVKDDEVLLVRNWLGNGAWSLPGGGAHRHESYLQAVAREVHEELGVMIEESEFNLVGSGTWASNGFRYAYQCSYVRLDDELRPRKRFLEITDAVFVGMDEARALPNVAPEISQAIAMVQAAKTL